MSNAPERIWVENLNSHWMKWPNADLIKPTDPHSTRIEYIRKDIADKEKVFNNVCSALWQAVKVDGINAGWIEK